MARLIGYARVSTEDQTTAAQLDALRGAGCKLIFKENASGGSRCRPELARALETVRAGDVLVVVRIDRLARSLSHLLEVVETLTRRGAGFRSLSDPIDTTSPQGMLTLQILGAVAQFERALIRERTKAGLRNARARGRVGGNPGLRTGDRDARRRVAAARDLALSNRVIDRAQEFLPIVRELRPAATWDQIVRVLNGQQLGRPGDGKPWTRDSLIRAVRRLVADGLAEASLLARTPRGADSDYHVRLVAMLANTLAEPTLLAIARRLEAAHEPTPRGSLRWNPSSVKNLLDRAKALGLVLPRLEPPADPAPATSRRSG